MRVSAANNHRSEFVTSSSDSAFLIPFISQTSHSHVGPELEEQSPKAATGRVRPVEVQDAEGQLLLPVFIRESNGGQLQEIDGGTHDRHHKQPFIDMFHYS